MYATAPVAVTFISNCVHVSVVEPVLFVIATAGGVSSTVTVTIPSSEQPEASVTVSVYNVVVAGEAIGSPILALDRPAVGDHE